MNRKVATLFLAMGILWASAANADSRAEAGNHFDRAIYLLDDGRVVEAIDEFKRSFDTLPNPKVLYNIGQAYIAIDKPVEAIDALRRYLNEGSEAISSQRRSEVEKEIALQESRIAMVTIRTTPAGASIGVNGREIGRTPLATPARMVPGEYSLSAALGGYESVEKTIAVAAGDRETIEIELVKRAGGAEASVEASRHGEKPDERPRAVSPVPVPDFGPTPTPNVEGAASRKRLTFIHVAGIALAGVGVVTCAMGAVLLLQAQSTNDRAFEQWKASQYDAADASMADAENLNRSGAITLVVGGVLAAGGAAVYLFAPSRRPALSSAVDFQPILGLNAMGVSARGVW